MKKLNCGCGDRLADGWVNIDFHSRDSRVRRANFLKGLPYPDHHFDVVYSSHVLEHFTREQARGLLREIYRVLKPDGIVRIVVPDLEETCKEYLHILALPDSDPSKSGKYEWMTIELLDQLVRSVPSGEMGAFMARLGNDSNPELLSYVRSRTKDASWAAPRRNSALDKLRRLTRQEIVTHVTYGYLKAVARLIPRDIRSMVFNGAGIGERHRWMYDHYGLKLMLERAGFCCCRSVPYNESAIPNFNDDSLDCNPDGSAYKNNSLYMEGRKDAETTPVPEGSDCLVSSATVVGPVAIGVERRIQGIE